MSSVHHVEIQDAFDLVMENIVQDINMCIINDENVIRVIALLNILREKIVVAHTEL